MRCLIALFAFAALASAELTEEQRLVPLEQESADANLAKIVILAGSPSNKAGQHEYFAGCAMLADWLRKTPGVHPVLAADGWPQNEQIFAGAKAVVIFADGGAKLPFLTPERWEKMKALIASGAGLVMLHQAVDVPETNAEELKSWLGAAWTKDIGCRGHWDMDFAPTASHASLRGVEPFAAPLDGWLYNLHFAEKGITPLLTGAVPDKSRTTADAKAHTGRAETIAWAYDRPNGGRSFAFTGCDLHKNWQVESQRRFVVNGILWTAKLEVPATGAPVPMQPSDLARNLDAKQPPKPPASPTPP